MLSRQALVLDLLEMLQTMVRLHAYASLTRFVQVRLREMPHEKFESRNGPDCRHDVLALQDTAGMLAAVHQLQVDCGFVFLQCLLSMGRSTNVSLLRLRFVHQGNQGPHETASNPIDCNAAVRDFALRDRLFCTDQRSSNRFQIESTRVQNKPTVLVSLTCACARRITK